MLIIIDWEVHESSTIIHLLNKCCNNDNKNNNIFFYGLLIFIRGHGTLQEKQTFSRISLHNETTNKRQTVLVSKSSGKEKICFYSVLCMQATPLGDWNWNWLFRPVNCGKTAEPSSWPWDDQAAPFAERWERCFVYWFAFQHDSLSFRFRRGPWSSSASLVCMVWVSPKVTSQSSCFLECDNIGWGWQGGSSGRASDSRSKDPRFEPRQEHKKDFWEFFLVKKCCADSLSVCPTPVCIYICTHKNDDGHIH